MNIPQHYIIETDRLVLRIPSLEDNPFVYSATRFEGFNEGMVWEPPNHADELIKPFEDVIQAWQNATAYNFTIVNKNNENLLGRISIRKEQQEKQWNIGFWMHPEQQNKGYMSEALVAIIRFGFSILGAESIIANYALWNKASEKVLIKNGMVFLKYDEKGFQKKGEWIPANFFEIKKSDFLEK